MDNDKKRLGSPDEVSVGSRRLNRRQIVECILATGAGGLLLPKTAAALPPHELMETAGAPLMAGQTADAIAWKPIFFDTHQNETFGVLAELILPGAAQARINRIVDSLLNVASQESQQKFLHALSAIDAESQRRFGHPFKTLSAEQQHAILEYASSSERGQPEEDRDWSWFMLPQKPSSAQPRLRDYFENFKSWVAATYLATETGMKDMGWTGNYLFPDFPDCKTNLKTSGVPGR